MAPRMLRDYHSTGGPDRYPLRTTRHSENNIPAVHNVDTSQINGKEDFFRCMGLRMKRSQHQYKMFSNNSGTKVVNIPVGVTLRDCSVVVLGSKCKLCGRCFKCEVDVNAHMKFKHSFHLTKSTRTDTKETNCTNYSNELCEIFSDHFERGTIITGRDCELKLHKRLQLILKIGKEVVSKISVKRKHLKINTSTQTESDGVTELNVDKEGYESNVSDIDPPVYRRIPCKYCNPTLCPVNGTNQYVVSNIVVGEENTEFERNHVSNKLTESRATWVDTNRCNNCRSTQTPAILDNSSTSNKDSNDFLQPCLNSNWNTRRNPNDFTSVTNDTNITSKENNKNKKQKDINANETFTDTSTEKESRNTAREIVEDSVIPQLRSEFSQHQSAPPVQLSSPQLYSALTQHPSLHRQHSVPPQVSAISQPQLTSSKSLSRCRRQSAPLGQSPILQQSPTPTPQTPSPQQPLTVCQQSSTPSQQPSLQEQAATPVNNGTDDEIQEVLRIIRGYNNNNNEEINHESPNRYEQELLLRDVIENMKKMEERGLHLLEKTFTKKRKRAPRKSNSKNGDAIGEQKKRKKSVAQSNTEKNVKSPRKKKCASNAKEQTTKIQNEDNVSIKDTLKENLLTGNANISNIHELLRGYGINFYNDVLEVNNNVENIQEPVNQFLAPCAGGMEDRRNRPIVIDLVNDTTE